jgi:hypothetical protein
MGSIKYPRMASHPQTYSHLLFTPPSLVLPSKMPKTEEHHIRPKGWENDPEEERLRFSSFDYLSACTYNCYAIYFKLEDEDRAIAIELLKKGLEVTLSQCRQLVGVIEKNPDNDDHSYVKKRDSTVKFVVKYFTAEDNVPSLSFIEHSHFVSSTLGDLNQFAVGGMSYGERPECLPSASPVLSAYQANFIPGGLAFVTNIHHYCNDIKGWANFAVQLAENCAAIAANAALPPWDPASLDASHFTATDFPSASKIDGPAPPDRHPDLLPHTCILLHLPPSNAAALKALATSPDQTTPISTYDAFVAYLWRITTKHRLPLYPSTPLTAPLLIGEAVNIRGPVDPSWVGPRQQRNLFWAAVSPHFPSPPTASQIVSEAEAPLSTLASFVRTMTNSITPAAVEAALAMLAPVRDKTCLFTRVNSFPPLSFAVTDWRPAGVVAQSAWGAPLGTPRGFRHPFGEVAEGVMLVYPPRNGEGQGCEFALAVERDMVEGLLADEDLNKYFEFRGFETK